MKSVLLIVSVALLAGCATAARLSPVQGPLATQSPPPTYKVSLEGDFMETKLGNGDTCRGEWLDRVPEDPSARDMSAEWDLVYGKGYFLANVLARPGIAHAILSCPTGSVEVEFDSKKGVARDKNDNVFKLTF
jgi:hypothetical protein